MINSYPEVVSVGRVGLGDEVLLQRDVVDSRLVQLQVVLDVHVAEVGQRSVKVGEHLNLFK